MLTEHEKDTIIETVEAVIEKYKKQAVPEAPEKEQPLPYYAENAFGVPLTPAPNERPAPDADVVEKMIVASVGSLNHSANWRGIMTAALDAAEPIITAKAREGYVLVSEVEKQIESVIEYMPQSCVVHIIREGGVLENLYATLAVSVSKLTQQKEKAEQQLATMYTLDAVREAFFDHFSEHDSYPTGDMVQCWGDIEEALTAKPKQERVTVTLLDGGWNVFKDGVAMSTVPLPKWIAELAATGLRAEIAAAEKEK